MGGAQRVPGRGSAAGPHDVDTIFFDVNPWHADYAVEGVGLGLIKGKRVCARVTGRSGARPPKMDKRRISDVLTVNKLVLFKPTEISVPDVAEDDGESTAEKLGLNRLHSSRRLSGRLPREVAPDVVGFEVAVPRLRLAEW